MYFIFFEVILVSNIMMSFYSCTKPNSFKVLQKELFDRAISPDMNENLELFQTNSNCQHL